jgi:hypothetical protein
MKRIWEEEKIEYLINNYNNFFNDELAKYLGVTKISLERKARELSLKKEKPWDDKKFREYVKICGNEEYEVLDKFSRMDARINIFHKVCGTVWNTTPGIFVYNGNRCNFCSPTRKITHKEFVNRMIKIDKNIEILGEYTLSINRILCKCKIHNITWNPIAGVLLGGKGKCPKCHKYYMKPQKEFEKELFSINSNILIIGKLVGMHKKIRVRCLIDGYEWDAIPSNLLQSVGCPRCNGVERYTTVTFSEKLFRIHPDIKVLGEYTNHYGKIKVQCLNDGYIWFPTPHTLFMGSGCPCCCSSRGEKYCSKFFNKNNIKHQTQYYFSDLLSDSNFHLRFDFAIFYRDNLYCLIEIDGIGHRKPIKFNGMSKQDSTEKYELIKHHDFLKDEYCKNNNISLLRIPYDGRHFKEIKLILESELNPLLERR